MPSHRILLVGNSHADSIKSTFAEAAQAANIAVFFIVENRPLVAGGVTTPEALVVEAQARGVDAIVLHYSPEVFDRAILERVAALAAPRSIRVLVILPVPVWERSVPLMLFDKLEKDGRPVAVQSIDDYVRLNRPLIDNLSAPQLAGVKVYPVAGVLCRTACRLQSDEGEPLYYDAGHLTLTGSRVLRPVFDELVADLSSTEGGAQPQLDVASPIARTIGGAR